MRTLFKAAEPTKTKRMDKLATLETILNWKGNDVYSVTPETTVFEALKLMRDKNVGALLVCHEGKLIGIISERDYARKIAIEGRNSRNTPVSDIITTDPMTLTSAATVGDCMSLMANQRIRHLPVLDGEKIIGVVSMGDLVKWMMHAQSATIDQLQSYISGSYTG